MAVCVFLCVYVCVCVRVYTCVCVRVQACAVRVQRSQGPVGAVLRRTTLEFKPWCCLASGDGLMVPKFTTTAPTFRLMPGATTCCPARCCSACRAVVEQPRR